MDLSWLKGRASRVRHRNNLDAASTGRCESWSTAGLSKEKPGYGRPRESDFKDADPCPRACWCIAGRIRNRSESRRPAMPMHPTLHTPLPVHPTPPWRPPSCRADGGSDCRRGMDQDAASVRCLLPSVSPDAEVLVSDCHSGSVDLPCGAESANVASATDTIPPSSISCDL